MNDWVSYFPLLHQRIELARTRKFARILYYFEANTKPWKLEWSSQTASRFWLRSQVPYILRTAKGKDRTLKVKEEQKVWPTENDLKQTADFRFSIHIFVIRMFSYEGLGVRAFFGPSGPKTLDLPNSSFEFYIGLENFENSPYGLYKHCSRPLYVEFSHTTPKNSPSLGLVHFCFCLNFVCNTWFKNFEFNPDTYSLFLIRYLFIFCYFCVTINLHK